jgi:eukaryotic-like serine/threonine-protein kinase
VPGDAPLGHIVRFSTFEVDLRSGELRKGGARVPLQDQPFKILVRLLEHRGELVTREALRQELWSGDTFVDFEHGLNAAIKRLRDALSDSADTPRFVETLPRRGYRFIASVEDAAPLASANANAARARGTRRTYQWALAASTLVALLVVVGLTEMRHAPVLTDRDTILVSDFVNKTGEEVFDDTLRQALTIDLEQSPFLQVVSRERVALVLRQMRRSPDERLIGNLAHEACERLGGKIAIDGFIVKIGNRYNVGLEAVNCATRENVAAEHRAAGRDEVMDALGASVSALRQRLGEARATLQQFDVPLPEATTASLDALKAFASAEETRRVKGDLAAEPFYRRALEIDPDFALAYARLSAVASNTNRRREQRRLAEAALARREHTTGRERLYIDLQACSLTDCDRFSLLELWKRSYPRDWRPHQTLCWERMNTFGDFDNALTECLEAVRLEPENALALVQLAAAYEALNRFADAKRVLAQTTAKAIDSETVHLFGFELSFILGDAAAMAAERRAMDGRPQEARLVASDAAAAAFEGRLRESRALTARAQALAAGRFDELAGEIRARAALIEAAADSAERRWDDEPGLETNFRARGDLLMASLLRGQRERATALLAAMPTTMPATEIVRPANILLSMEANDRSAAHQLPPASPRDLAEWTPLRVPYLRGLVFLRAGDGHNAANEFQRIVERRGVGGLSCLYPVAYVQQARASVMSGDTARARTAYERFFELWKHADSDVPLLRDARAEYARLPAALQ